jgi:hypothetical protein
LAEDDATQGCEVESNYARIARYFLALCEERSFTRAGSRCGIAQSSMTNAIALNGVRRAAVLPQPEIALLRSAKLCTRIRFVWRPPSCQCSSQAGSMRAPSQQLELTRAHDDGRQEPDHGLRPKNDGTYSSSSGAVEGEALAVSIDDGDRITDEFRKQRAG